MPRVPLVRVGRPGDVLGVLALVVTRRRVVADGVQAELGRLAVDGHLGAAVDGHAADVGGLLPEDLGEVTPLVEGVHVGGGAECTVDVGLGLVPGLGHAGGGVVRVAGDGEEVLALAVDGVVLEVAEGGGVAGSGLAVVGPLEVGGVVVGASAVVVPEHGVLVVGALVELGLALAGDVVYAVDGGGGGRRGGSRARGVLSRGRSAGLRRHIDGSAAGLGRRLGGAGLRSRLGRAGLGSNAVSRGGVAGGRSSLVAWSRRARGGSGLVSRSGRAGSRSRLGMGGRSGRSLRRSGSLG